MARQTIPDDQQFARNVTPQMREKLDDRSAANGSGKQPEVEIPPRHARDRPQHLPVEMILQHRCLSSWRPSTTAVRALLNPLSSMKTMVRPSFLAFFLTP